MRKNEKFDQLDSNNEAEYAALWVLLRELEELGVHHLSINIKGDSQVVINQARGEWPVYEIEFEKWLNRIEEKVNKLGLTTHFEMIGRKENREADQLATQALQGTFVVSNRELVAE